MLDYRENVDIQQYHLDLLTTGETLSVSIAKQMLRSPHHGWAAHPRFGGHPKPVTFDMKLGTILDEVMTNQEKRLGLVPFDAYTSNAARAARDAVVAQGLVPVKQKELDKARERAASVDKNLRFHGIDLDPFKRQVCFLWDAHASNGNTVQCRCLLDYFKADAGGVLIRDLKSTKNCQPGPALEKKAILDGYHIQAAAYIQAVETVYSEAAGLVRFENIWVETEWPYEPCVTSFSGEALQLGRVQWQRAVDAWELSLRTNKWPGYMRNGVAHEIGVPAFLLGDMFEEDEPEEEEAEDDGLR